MIVDPIKDADLLRRLADTCPGCGLHRVVDGRCTQCGTDKVPFVATVYHKTSEAIDCVEMVLGPAPNSGNGDTFAGKGSEEPASNIQPIQILAEPDPSSGEVRTVRDPLVTACAGQAPEPAPPAPKTPRKRRGPAAEGTKQGDLF